MSLQAEKQPIPDSVSLNFSVAKVIAILLVVSGHWFGGILWVPVTIGLFVFAFSSAYFTSRIYGAKIDGRRFWRQKMRRLGVGYWVILLFLSLVVLLKGGTIFHWHSLVHAVGMSGLLNWFGIKNQSGLGAGLWFFTLLLAFYVVYPYLARINASRRNATLLALAGIALACYLEEHVKVGHELWLTSLGFLLGVALGFHQIALSSRYALLGAASACFLLLATNLLTSFKGANTEMICLASILVSVWLIKANLPAIRPLMLLAGLEKYLLEIFLIHTYLFIHPTGTSSVDFLLSMILIMVSAVLLHKMTAHLLGRFFAPRLVAEEIHVA